METNNPPEKEIIDVPPEPRPPVGGGVERPVEVVETRVITQPESQPARGNVIIGRLNIFNAPVNKYLGEPMRQRYHKHYHPRHKHGGKHLIADIFLALSVVALVAFNVYLFFFAAPGLQEKVAMTIGVTPETLKSGERVLLTVDYENKSDAVLRDAKLSILCPCDASPLVAEPAAQYDPVTHTFSLGDINSHGNGSVRFSWTFFGTVGEMQHFAAALSYGTDLATRRETKSVVHRAPVNDSVVRTALDMPAFFVHEGTSPFAITVTNTGAQGFDSILLRPSWSEAFEAVEADTPFNDGAFRAPLLLPGQTHTIRGIMRYHGRGEQEATFSVATFLNADRPVLQREEQYTARIFYPKFVATPPANNAALLTLGVPFTLSFDYENGESEDVVDVSLALDPPSDVFPLTPDTASLTQQNKITNPSLALIRTKAKGVFTFTLPTRTSVHQQALFHDGDPVIFIPYVLSYRLASAPQNVVRLEREMHVKINSDLAIDAFGRYYTPEGDQLGRGSLPPRVEETTRYWVFVPVTNSISDVENMVVTMQLGSAVEWTKKSSVTLGDPLSYDERARTITWRLPRVTKYSGGEYPDVGAAVELALTPGPEDVGKEMILVESVSARGRDTFTGTTIERTAGAVTTNLVVDRRTQGKSRVVPQF